MPVWRAPDDVGLVYDVRGEGRPALLLHGFASSARINWERPGVAQALVDAGHTVVTFDARGHGRSDAPHDPASYSRATLAADAAGLLAALGMHDADLVGYSMGAQVAVEVSAGAGGAGRLVLGGVGAHLLSARGGTGVLAQAIAEALEAADAGSVTNATGRSFRSFADATKSDRLALAALQRAQALDGPAPLAGLTVPVLVVVGARDTLAGDPDELASQIPGAQVVVVPGDHLSAVLAPEFRAAVVGFLAR